MSGLAQQNDPEKLIEAGHWKKARALVEARANQSPADSLCVFLLSQIHHAFGDDSTPRLLAEKAVALDGRVAKYHRQLAETVGVEAQHAGPIQLIFLARQFRKELDIAISLDPRDLQAQRDLLEFYLVAPRIAGGDLPKASATAEHIAELDAAEGYLARARVATVRGQTGQAEAFLRKATEAQPPNFRARTELARFYLSKERASPGAAELVARETLKLDKSRVEPYTTLAEVYAGRRDWNSLDSLLVEASVQVPDDLSPWFRAADVLLGTGQEPDRAERYLRTYLAQEPEGNEPTTSDARRNLELAIRAQGRRTVLAAAERRGRQ